MSTPQLVIRPVSFDYTGAAAATGFSEDVIRRAVNAGDLTVRYPKVAGRTLSKPVIAFDELHRWVESGATERSRS